MQPQLMSMGLTLGVHSMTRVLIVFQFKVTFVTKYFHNYQSIWSNQPNFLLIGNGITHSSLSLDKYRRM